MMINIVTKRRFKVIAVFIVINLLGQIGFPTVAFALTSGPSQPEAGSFEPVNTNQMVDLFSGDFTYNIPLMNVPGPNGGYPINLAYHAGIGMEQEASWVGLGWNVNAGVINRNLRGVPDDFNGDAVKKTLHMKPQRRIGLSVANQTDIEIFGFELDKTTGHSGASLQKSMGFYYDNYKGVGSTFGAGLALNTGEGGKGPMEAGLGLTSDSKEGLGVSPSLSYSGDMKKGGFGFELGLGMNSRQGLSSITFKSSVEARTSRTYRDGKGGGKFGKLRAGTKGTGVSFSSSSYVPMMDFPRGGFAGELEVKFGADAAGTDTNPISLSVKYNENHIIDNEIDFPAYGYLYAENDDKGTNIADFNREKDIPVNKKSKSLPIPSATYDVFTVKGQGVGGAFRTYRSDIGVFNDPKINSFSGSGGIGAELAAGTPTLKVGFNPKIAIFTSYSGPWQAKDEGVTDFYSFQPQVDGDAYEPSYFKSLGEMLPSAYMDGGEQNTNDLPFRFEVGSSRSGLTFVPTARELISINSADNTPLSTAAKTTEREKRLQSIQYLTNNELSGSSYAQGHGFTNTYSATTSDYQNATHSYAANDQIGMISVVNPDGNRYIYGLPAYNTLQKDVQFSIEDETSSTRLITYDSGDNDTGNDQGLSNLYSATEMPDYAHSHLLTEVLSPDYVDLTGNGPTDDDLGYWVKFNYIERSSDYRWRAPYGSMKANHIEGKITNAMDDMAGYSYGTKEIMYLESIETKTHVAEYYMSVREDGLGVATEDGAQDTGQELLKLDKIVLRSKTDLTKAIKTVHFGYDYSLCQGTPNSVASGGGKLTLKKVWFTYLDNDVKGALSPYEFDYSTVNPNYNIEKMERWGNYTSTGPFTGSSSNQNYPYVDQVSGYATRASDASAWNLTEIKMPSGGILTVDYESDDYAYVQNRKAMQMFKIIGTGHSGGKNTPSSGNRYPLTNDDVRLYIELNKTMTQPELEAMVAGVDQVYFKAYMKLKNQFQEAGSAAVDYVEGYAKMVDNPVFNTNFGFDNGGSSDDEAWITIQNVPPGQLIQTDINPIKLAGLREIRFNRSDLTSGQNTGMGAISSIASIMSVTPTVINTVKDLIQMITGFYNYGIMGGWCDELHTSTTYPSYVRLNTADGKKYGGGCRVKSVDLDDNWEGLNTSSYKSSTYGQVYSYVLEDGVTSSGVAEYEPLIGGEENPFRQPMRYSSERMLIKDNALMIEEPYNESLFPSANVGYSRVVVRNRTQYENDDSTPINKAVSGVTVNEFYTARDFPVDVKNTDVDYSGYNITIPVPFIGSYVHHNNGYSQGFSVELNNMHGKPYSVATYAPPLSGSDPQPGDPGVEPIAATYYYYKTQDPYVRHKTSGNKLDNSVTVMTGDAIKVQDTEIGKHVDTYIDMRENKTTSNTMEVVFNVNAAPFYIIPGVIMTIDNSMSMFRSITTNKVITRNGILDKQLTTKEGARTVTQNLYYDAETGSPLMTTTTNDFDKPIYDYTYAAHWEHEGMQGAYQNVGAIVTSTSSPLIKQGDELVELNNGDRRIWVEGGGIFRDKLGASVTPTGGRYKIARSGYRNQQSVPSGNIVALSDPTGNRNYPLFTKINSLSSGFASTSSGDFLSGTLPQFTDCFDEEIRTIKQLSICPSSTNKLVIEVPECCDNLVVYGGEGGGGESVPICPNGLPAELIDEQWMCKDCPDVCTTDFQGVEFESGVDLTSSSEYDFTNLTLTKHGNKVKAVFGNGKTIWGDLVRLECLNECLEDVLHASSAKFNSSWAIDYADAGVIFPTGHPSAGNNPADNTNRYGAENIWRLSETYLFDIDRKQEVLNGNLDETQTGINGTYENFVLFNWSDLSVNLPWTKTNTINRYSPYGYELENEDALGIKSAALYGYNNSVVTAVASNTSYYGFAFDGFEDYNYPTNSSLPLSSPTTNYGHFELGSATLTNAAAHTGDVSVVITSGNHVEFAHTYANQDPGKFIPDPSTYYYFSAWVKVDDPAANAELIIDGNSIDITSVNEQKIEGWQRIEGKFLPPALSTSIKVKANSGTIYLDDIRLQPQVSAMKSYVYYPNTLWLRAELDDRNYATFYNYDEEGNLIQIKKETKDGLRTIVSNRKNVKKNPTPATP